MNIDEIIKKVIKHYINESLDEFEAYGLQPQQIGNAEFLKNQLIQYINSFPPNTQSYVLDYASMNRNQRYFMGLIASCVGKRCEQTINYVYSQKVRNHTYKEIGNSPEDLTQEFLTGGIAKNILRGSMKYKSGKSEKANALYGLPTVIGQFIDQNIRRIPTIDGKEILSYVNEAAKNLAINVFNTELKAPDSPLRTDLNLSGAEGDVSSNGAFSNEGENIILNILNDKSIHLRPQQRILLQTLMDVAGSQMSPERLTQLAYYRDKRLANTNWEQEKNPYAKENQIIYQEISDRTGIPPVNVSKQLGDAIKVASQSKYAKQGDRMDFNKIKPTTPTNPTTPGGTMARINQASKIKPKQKPAAYNVPNYTIGAVSESRNNDIYNKNRVNMRQKILISESVLRQMIVRALNEAKLKKSDGLNYEALANWAEAVRDGKDPIHCREFGPFYETLIRDYRCREAVKLGVSQENAALSTEDNADRRPSIKIDELFNRSGVADDILQDFFIGEKCTINNESLNDSILGSYFEKITDENGNEIQGREITFIEQFVNTILMGSEKDFFTFLCRVLNTYGRHYYRKHYKEWVMQYGMGSSQIGGDKSNSIQDQQNDDTDDNFQDNDTDDTTVDNEIGMSGGDSAYYAKLVDYAQRVLNSEHLSPRHRMMIQALIDVAQNKMENPERFKELTQLRDRRLGQTKDKQSFAAENQVIYQEIADRTGLPVEVVCKRLGDALKAAAATRSARKYAQKLSEERKQKIQKIVNEVIKRIMAK